MSEKSDYSKVIAMLEGQAERIETKNHPRFVLSQKDREQFLKDKGITKAMITQIKEAEEELVTGAYIFGGQKVEEEIKLAKKNGKDPDTVAVEVVLKSAMGPDKLVVSAHKTYRNPLDPGKSVESYGPVRHTCSRDRLFGKDACADVQDRIKAALGVK